MKINYIIASWSGARVKPANNSYYENVLKNHLKFLSEMSHSLSQITVMKPLNNVKNDYYDIDVDENVKIIECKNEYQSYGQWLNAIKIFIDDFDYFILIEDDYVPATDNFDEKLIKIYNEGTYLCSMVPPGVRYKHCAISNGIISRTTIHNLISTIDYKKWFDTFAEKNPILVMGGTNYQWPFSRYLADNGIELLDYRQHYRSDYFANDIITDFSLLDVMNEEKIFTPIQNKI